MTKPIGILYHEKFLWHTKQFHPEHKGRLTAILNLLAQQSNDANLVWLTPTPATTVEVALVHSKSYIETLQKKVQARAESWDLDTYLTPHSFETALLSAGAMLTAVRAVLRGDQKVCFSFGRPPGHHATPDTGMGFCLFNNGAIGAKAALQEFGLKRILYIDWDVHHGNGTQDAFYDNPQVLFVSIHQDPAYPGTGAIDELGKGAGYGYNINIPLPANCGDVAYNEVFEKVIIPLADKYQPELVMVSAGYDAYVNDPLGGMALTTSGYANMTKQVMKIAEKHCAGKMVFCLEGGYHLTGQAEAVWATLASLSGSFDDKIIEKKEVQQDIAKIIAKVQANMKVIDEAHN